MRRIIRGFVEDIVLDPLRTFTFIKLSYLFSEEHDNIYIFYRPLPKRFIGRFVELIEKESSALLTQEIAGSTSDLYCKIQLPKQYALKIRQEVKHYYWPNEGAD